MSTSAPELPPTQANKPTIPEGIVTPPTIQLFGKIPEPATNGVKTAGAETKNIGEIPRKVETSPPAKPTKPKADKPARKVGGSTKGKPVGKTPPGKKPVAPAPKVTAKATVNLEKKPAVKAKKKPEPALIVMAKPSIEQEIEATAQRFEQILGQHQNPEIKAGWMPKDWESNIDLAGMLRTLRPGTATFTKANKVSIDCGTPAQSNLLKEILASTDPKQPGKPTTSAAGFLKHFRHIARAASRGKNAADAFAKLVKTGEICAAYLELLEQKHQPETSNIGKTLDIQVLATKAEIIRQNHPGDQTENMLSLIPNNLDHPVQMVMMPDPTGAQIKMVMFQPHISLNYTEQETPIQKTLKNANWRATILWIGVGLLIQAVIVIGLLAHNAFFNK